MNLKHHDIIIPHNDPFTNCELDRKKYAEVLTGIVRTYSDGFVMAISNEWGTGKTTFVKMWKQALENQGLQTIYFNAWENDFQNEALAAILGEFKAVAGSDNNKSFKGLVEKGAILSKSILPGVLKAIASKYIDTEAIQDLIENVTEGTSEIFTKEVEEYSKKKKGLLDFKRELSEFIKNSKIKQPLVFIIDELDRCRPNYAVEVLEQIKHIFSVPGIVFILSIDKTQLANAVRGAYGSDLINADEYLRRFIDLEYSIPEPNTQKFATYLFNYFELDQFFNDKERLEIREFQQDTHSYIKFAQLLFTDKSLTLRQQEKIIGNSSLIIGFFTKRNYVFPTVLLFLIYLRNHNSSIYLAIQKKQFSLQDFVIEMESFIPKNLSITDTRIFIYLIGIFLSLYRNYISIDDYSNDLVKFSDESTETSLYIESKYEKDLLKVITMFYNDINVASTDIKWLINKVDMMESVVI